MAASLPWVVLFLVVAPRQRPRLARHSSGKSDAWAAMRRHRQSSVSACSAVRWRAAGVASADMVNGRLLDPRLREVKRGET